MLKRIKGCVKEDRWGFKMIEVEVLKRIEGGDVNLKGRH